MHGRLRDCTMLFVYTHVLQRLKDKKTGSEGEGQTKSSGGECDEKTCVYM